MRTKFHTHTKQQAKLQFCISYSLNFWVSNWKAEHSAPNDSKHCLTAVCSLSWESRRIKLVEHVVRMGGDEMQGYFVQKYR
jgi:hypothetical protein